MTCTTCGRENPPHLAFCQECGQRLGPRVAPPTPPIGLPGQDASPQATGREPRCRVCDTVNGPGLRYCTSCGSTLEAGPPPPAFAPAAPIPIPVPSLSPIGPAAAPRPIPAPAPAIAPVRVVDLAAGASPAEAARTCARCRGLVDAGAAFCKFCGASLADAAPAPAPPHAIPQVVQAPAVPPPAAPDLAREKGRGRLVVISKSGADGPSYPIGDSLDIGRLEGQIVVAEDPYLSPRHARVSWVAGGRLLLRDLGSTNGVFLRLSGSRDFARARPGPGSSGEVAVPLQDQDLILVGQQVLRFEVVKDTEQGLGPAAEHGTLLFGSPAGPRYARLGQRTVEGVTRDVYYVRKVETVLGRESGDVVFTEDPFLSRRHAAIRVLGRDGSPLAAGGKPSGDLRFALVDLGSSNGTFLRIRSEIELASGDHFRVGQQLFRVDFESGHAA